MIIDEDDNTVTEDYSAVYFCLICGKGPAEVYLKEAPCCFANICEDHVGSSPTCSYCDQERNPSDAKPSRFYATNEFALRHQKFLRKGQGGPRQYALPYLPVADRALAMPKIAVKRKLKGAPKPSSKRPKKEVKKESKKEQEKKKSVKKSDKKPESKKPEKKQAVKEEKKKDPSKKKGSEKGKEKASKSKETRGKGKGRGRERKSRDRKSRERRERRSRDRLRSRSTRPRSRSRSARPRARSREPPRDRSSASRKPEAFRKRKAADWKRNTVACEFWIGKRWKKVGSCPNGKDCTFRHDPLEQRKPPSKRGKKKEKLLNDQSESIYIQFQSKRHMEESIGKNGSLLSEERKKQKNKVKYRTSERDRILKLQGNLKSLVDTCLWLENSCKARTSLDFLVPRKAGRDDGGPRRVQPQGPRRAALRGAHGRPLRRQRLRRPPARQGQLDRSERPCIRRRGFDSVCIR